MIFKQLLNPSAMSKACEIDLVCNPSPWIFISWFLSAKSTNKGTCPPDQDVFDLCDAHPNTLIITAFKFSSAVQFKLYCSLCHFDKAYEYLMFVGGPIVMSLSSLKVWEFPYMSEVEANINLALSTKAFEVITCVILKFSNITSEE